MNSMEALAKGNQFKGFGTTGVLSVILAGYLVLTGSAFWSFTNRSAPSNDGMEQGTQAPRTLVCDCRYEKQSAVKQAADKNSAEKQSACATD